MAGLCGLDQGEQQVPKLLLFEMVLPFPAAFDLIRKVNVEALVFDLHVAIGTSRMDCSPHGVCEMVLNSSGNNMG